MTESPYLPGPLLPRDVLAGAVELARAAAVETAGDPPLVGEHLGAVPEPVSPATDEVAPEALGEVLTHTFASRLPGYVGWHWAVTVARIPGEDDRHRRRGRAAARRRRAAGPGVGAVARAAAPRRPLRRRRAALHRGRPAPGRRPTLVDDDSAEDPEGRVVAFELGLGRERVMSAEGRGEAVEPLGRR